VAGRPKLPVNGSTPPARPVVELPAGPREPERPPARLRGRRERELWRELHREPVAELWTDGDRRLALRLVLLLARIERDPEPAVGLYGAVQGVEDRLLLNPRSRRAAGVTILPPPPLPPAADGVPAGTLPPEVARLLE
jgi:hypothetical protein